MTSHDGTSEHTDAASRASSSRHRYRQAGLTSVATTGARSISVLTAIAIVPLALGYLGTERYGIWLTLGSLLALLGFMDLALGNAVMTTVARTGSGAHQAVPVRSAMTDSCMLAAVVAARRVGRIVVNHFLLGVETLKLHSGGAARVASGEMLLVGALLGNTPLGVVQEPKGRLRNRDICSLGQRADPIVDLLSLLAAVHRRWWR